MQESRDRLRFAALGRTKWLLSTIEVMTEAYELVLVATGPASPEYGVDEQDFERAAARFGAAFYSTSRGSREALDAALSKAKPDVAVSVNWPYLLPRETIAAVPNGILNAHAGDLPRFRGNAAPNWAILAGEKEVVLSIHEMTPELDSGPIHAQESMHIADGTYIGDVYDWLSDAVPRLMLRAVRAIEDGTSRPYPQPADPTLSLRGFPRIPEDSRIDWSASAEAITRLVRASSEPFGGAYTFLGGERLTVWRARCEVFPFPWLGSPGQVARRDPSNGEVTVLTGEQVVVLEEVEFAGDRGRPADVIRSTRVRLGLSLEQELRALRTRVGILEALMKEPNA